MAPRVATQLESWDEEAADDVEIDQTQIADTDFSDVTRLIATGSTFKQVLITGVNLDKCDCTDVEFGRLEAAGLRTYKARFQRVTFTDCRLTGADFAEAIFEDCVFKNVKLDEAGFRFAKFTRVRFEDCMLSATDFSSARFAQVMFTSCNLEGTNFDAAQCANTDISSEDITNVRGILGLKGATISPEQLVQIAPLLAAELGFQIAP
jgi:uncharacterized protein YjbI with pentapeptide repeats